MIKVYFSPEIYKIASKLISHAKNNLVESEYFPTNYCNLDIGMVTLLKEGEIYPMHDDDGNRINKITFLNNNGGMRFFDLDVKALKGLTIEFETSLPHQPYTEKGNRWALVQRHEKS